jgi:uroporphyrinogen decarboxylase
MTGKEIALMALAGDKPPRLPVTAIGGGAWYVNDAGKTFAQVKDDPQAIADVFIKAYQKIGHDLMWTGASLINYPIHLLGCAINDDTSDAPLLEGAAIDDLAKLGSLDMAAAQAHPLMQGIIKSHHLVADAIGGQALLLATTWGPFTTAGRILGMEEMMMAMLEEPEELHKLLSFCNELLWGYLRPIMEHGNMAGLNLSEPAASGDLISPDAFANFAAPYHKDLVDRARELGKKSMLHICGDSSGVLDQVLDIAPDSFSLEAKVDLGQAREVLGGKVCVTGNLAPTGVFRSGTPQEVIAEAKQAVAAWGDAGGFILSLGCDFPKDVPYENIQALMSLKQA